MDHQALVTRATNALRKLALDENAKTRFCSDPLLQPFMHRVTWRYVAGRTIEDALARVAAINARGHAASVDYMGESCRDEARANAETEVFLALIRGVDARRLNCSISLDLSHIGSFETLLGLGTEQLDNLQRRGFPTREYVHFGEEHFLYVLNRIAEEPARLYQAVIDVMEPQPSIALHPSS